MLSLALALPTHADEWQPVSPEDLRMTREPKAPTAAAIYLYRQVDRNDAESTESIYSRIKILTDARTDPSTVSELAFYLCAGFFAVLAPLCCVMHTKSPDDMRIREVGSISFFGGWLALFIGGVFMDMGSTNEYGKLFFGVFGWAPALGSFFFWYFVFWLYHKIAGRPWPTRFADERVIRSRRWWH